MKQNYIKFILIILSLLPLFIIYSLILNDSIQFIALSHEPLSYRFLVSSRIINGDSYAWFPQGHLTTIFHNLIIGLNEYNNVSIENLNNALQRFTFLHHAIIFSILLIVIASSFKLFSCRDILNTYTFGLMIPLVASGIFATHYFVNPDYLTLNIILTILALAIFHFGVNLKSATFNQKTHYFLAIFVGVLVSNKVTMLPIAIFAALPFIFNEHTRVNKQYLKKTIVNYGLISFLTLILAIILFFNLNITNLFNSLLPMLKFILRPGSTEPNYDFFKVIVGYKFIYLMIINLLVLAYSIYKLNYLNQNKKYIFYSIYLLSALLWFFILKRGATMTLFESSYGLIIFSIGILKILYEEKLLDTNFKKNIIPIFLSTLIIMSVSDFKKTIVWFKSVSEDKLVSYETYKKISFLTKDNKKYFITYDNGASAPSIEMFLRKGLSKIPTWSHSKETLVKYSNLCKNCEFISSYNFNEFTEIVPDKGSFIVTYIPEYDSVKAINLEKDFLKNLQYDEVLSINEILYAQDFKVSIKKIK